MMRRFSMSNKTMEWICFTLREASSDQKKTIRRWKTAEREAEHFCTGNIMNMKDLLVSFPSITVIPELAMNAGWHDITFKIERFIKCSKRMEVPRPPRITTTNYSYAKTVKDSKWQSKTIKEAGL